VKAAHGASMKSAASAAPLRHCARGQQATQTDLQKSLMETCLSIRSILPRIQGCNWVFAVL